MSSVNLSTSKNVHEMFGVVGKRVRLKNTPADVRYKGVKFREVQWEIAEHATKEFLDTILSQLMFDGQLVVIGKSTETVQVINFASERTGFKDAHINVQSNTLQLYVQKELVAIPEGINSNFTNNRQLFYELLAVASLVVCPDKVSSVCRRVRLPTMRTHKEVGDDNFLSCKPCIKLKYERKVAEEKTVLKTIRQEVEVRLPFS